LKMRLPLVDSFATQAATSVLACAAAPSAQLKANTIAKVLLSIR
jgi:hypothetical protein